jgi:sortase A
VAFGIACLVFYAVSTARTALYQRRAKAELDRLIEAPRPSEVFVPAAPGELIGRVDVPRLKLSAAVVEGDDESAFDKAVGHLPDTPMPWQNGNVAFAAHRDTFFRPLKDIRIDDEVRVVTPRGEYRYRVRKTQIVNPEDVSVLAPTEQPSLTLITCYPFYFVGSAPRRFIVQAERVDAEPPGIALAGIVSQ